MKKVKYFIFCLICLFSCSMVYAESEVVIKSITPVYDETSSVIVTETDNKHNVVFNDKNQNVKYNVVIENTSDKDLTVQSIKLTTPSEDFLKYELEGLNSADVLKGKSTKEVVISLSTIKKDGWGRNFDDDLTATINFGNPIGNPNTKVGDTVTWVIIIAGASTLGMVVTIIAMVKTKNKKIVGIIVLTIAVGSLIPMVKAEETVSLLIKTNVSFESQNVMMIGACSDIYWDEDTGTEECERNSFWGYDTVIKNIYIENQIRDINNYAYEFDVSELKNGKVMAYLVTNEEELGYYDLYLLSDGIMYPNTDASFYFAYMYKLDSINNLEGFDTSNVTNMSHMFRDTGKWSDNFTLDLSNFDTSNVTDMSDMFNGAVQFGNKNFIIDVSNFDTSKVTDMSGMFSSACYNCPSFSLDLSNFDTSNVTDMSDMFSSAGFSSLNFTLDLSNFDTSKVTNMSNMFKNTGKWSDNFTLDVSSFDTSNVTDMSGMFYWAGYKSLNFTLDLSNFDTSKVTNMNEMFKNLPTGNINITIKKPNISWTDIFYGTAVTDDSLITVNYTSETSELVDEIKNHFKDRGICIHEDEDEEGGYVCLKYGYSNIVKGVQVD